MRSFSYIIYNLFYKPILKLYLRSDSSIHFDGFRLKILKGVFHPKLFFSTKYFYDFLKERSFTKVRFLEIGCGSGILSLLAYRSGANVTAVDIDKKAVENTRINFSKNFEDAASVQIMESNVFENVPKQSFDMIAINPPYYFKKILSNEQHAWYCGENGEYFESLFSGLSNYVHTDTSVFMILEENCEIDRIKNMASGYQIHFELVSKKKIRWETSYIFKLVQSSATKH